MFRSARGRVLKRKRNMFMVRARYGVALCARTEWEVEDDGELEIETRIDVLDEVWLDHPGKVELVGVTPCNASSTFHLSTFRDDDRDGEFYGGTSSIPSEPFCVRELGGVAGWDGPLEVWLHTEAPLWHHTCGGAHP